MPHVIVMMDAGRSDAQAVKDSLGYGDDAVSVSIEDVAPKDLAEKGLSARHRREAAAAHQEAWLQPALT